MLAGVSVMAFSSLVVAGSASAKGGNVPSFTSTQPPGFSGISKVMGYLLYGVTAVCVVGVLLVAGTMAVENHRGQGAGQHVTRLFTVLAAAVVAGSASALVAGVA